MAALTWWWQAAVRTRKRVLLEKSLTLGGLATLGLINLFVSMCNGRGRHIIKGVCEALSACRCANGMSPGFRRTCLP